jgi:hypothetical protein
MAIDKTTANTILTLLTLSVLSRPLVNMAVTPLCQKDLLQLAENRYFTKKTESDSIKIEQMPCGKPLTYLRVYDSLLSTFKQELLSFFTDVGRFFCGAPTAFRTHLLTNDDSQLMIILLRFTAFVKILRRFFANFLNKPLSTRFLRRAKTLC